MTEPTPRPSRLLKLAAIAAPWVLGLVLGMWLVLGMAWGALHGWIVPRIAEFRPQLEATATRVLGAPVRIGSISATSGWLVPSFELNDVVLLDAQGREGLRLARVSALLSPRSLVRLGFEQLVIDGPVLDVRRTAEGRILLAGIDISGDAQGGDGWAGDWLFSQREVAVRQATVRWTDEQQRSDPVELQQADLVIRNGSRRHLIRLDATPPAEWGERFSLRATMRQSLLNPRRGNWREWDGPVYADFPGIDLSRLRPHVDLGAGHDVELLAGRGALRVWADVVHGDVLGGTADLALQDASARLGADLAPLAFDHVQGRLTGKQLASGLELATEQLRFALRDGEDGRVDWPRGDVFLTYMRGESRVPGQGQLRADRIDLGALAEVARRLPLSPEAHGQLAAFAPRGQVEQLNASWTGRIEAPASYRVRGRVQNLAIAAGALPAARPDMQHPIGRPGLRGAAGTFDLNQGGGQATLSIAQGAMEFPGVFEEPLVPMDSLDAELRWQRQGARLTVHVPSAHFANADGAGELQARWASRDAPADDGQPHGPGVLDLAGKLTRADGTRVHRYLPLVVGDDARHYVRDAVQQGKSSSVQFKVKGDLEHFPYQNPKLGEFNITAQVQDVVYAYVPARLQNAGELPWPALARLSGRLVFDRNGMQVREAKGQLAGLPGFAVTRAEADIPDFGHAQVAVRAEGRGPLAEMLAMVGSSPLAQMTGGALAQATATGAADLKLQLALPLADLARSKVQGSVLLPGNDVRMQPDTSLLARTRGSVNFSETGFTLAGLQTRVFGGDARVEGGSRGDDVNLRLQGEATAEGLRQAGELGVVARLAQQATGGTAYAAALTMQNGALAFNLDSSLQGLALNLPAPLAKPADTAWPLRVALAPQAGTPRTDQLAVELGPLLSAQFVRDLSGTEPRVLRGAIGLGLLPDETAPLPPSGVVANVRLDTVSVDAWQAVLGDLSPAAAGAAPAPAGAAGGDSAFLPDRFALRAGELRFGGRSLHQLVVGGSRQGSTWRANVDAHELNGYVEYRAGAGGDAASGRVHARLARLAIAQGSEDEVTTLLDQQPSAVPALDVVIEDFELRGKKLGRLEMDAVNRGGAEWRLNKLHLAMPEADFLASGSWAAGPNGQARRTVMDFKLDIQDAGALLARLAMPGVFRRGAGRMEGQVAWTGSPLSLDEASLGGQFHLDVENGQFLKADAGAARLLGVLSLQALPRRLTLDFRDLFSEGFAFDFIRGDVRIARGKASTNNLQMKGVSAAVLLDGSADITQETQDIRVVVVPEINAGTASLVATVINPAIGVGTFLAQWLLRRPLMEAATQQFHIDGTWSDPRIERVARSGPTAVAEERKGGTPPSAGATP
ncbi:YhdP family protein [Pseudorhodoferax sp. Leaf267]|uniref:YhdP family protein n=1 Tax=Pseudorhodoferax sp. Leaf267 TaxID=1736316 RepID=UPI0006F645B5|nr:YhdP family protein [Pseudorhodoferax sp. Leaf267]KQP12744.1 hypothetical protein ASF43_21225 [Pseudorhodoferax sp. Leaf267]